MANRYFIFRVNGIDNGIFDDPTKAAEIHELFLKHGFKHTDTDINCLTTTYYYTI